MQLTKEKGVFAIAAVITLALCLRIHKPQVESVPPVPPEEAPHVPRVPLGAPIPPMRPEKPYSGSPRDPFVRTTDWVQAVPAYLAVPAAAGTVRALPGGAPPGRKAPPIVVTQEPKADPQEPDPASKDQGDPK